MDEDLGVSIQKEWALFRESAKRTLLHALTLGELLIEAKESIPHGEWMPWLGRFCPDITPQHARRFMRVAKHRALLEAKSENVAELTLTQALTLLPGQKEHDVPSEDDHDESEIMHKNNQPTEENICSRRPTITPKPPVKKGQLEKVIGDEDAGYIRAWYGWINSKGAHELAKGITKLGFAKPILKAIAATIKSGEVVHAPVATLGEFDVRMPFPHIPKFIAMKHRNKDLKAFTRKHRHNGKSDWERLGELNLLCREKSDYTIEKSAPNGQKYRLRTDDQEDRIGRSAWQWWNTGHWPGDKLTLQLITQPTDQMNPGSIFFYGRKIWPIEVYQWEDPDAPDTPTQDDVDNVYWFAEEFLRTISALRDTQGNLIARRVAAQFLRNWSKFLGDIKRPIAAKKIMVHMADAFECHPERESQTQGPTAHKIKALRR